MITPEIRIFYASLYRVSVSEPLWKQFGFSGTLDSDETLEEYAQNYRTEWGKHQAKILPALCEALGLEFYRSVIDVACMPGVKPASDPLIMPFNDFPDRFMDVLTHELCHVLLTDNDTYSIKSTDKEVNLLSRWHGLFGGSHEFNTLAHIPVHALSKHIYLDILQEPSRFERDMEHVKGDTPYKRAWEYVNKHDYRHIITQLRDDYEELRKELTI
jgi:hypothetical protein